MCDIGVPDQFGRCADIRLVGRPIYMTTRPLPFCEIESRVIEALRVLDDKEIFRNNHQSRVVLASAFRQAILTSDKLRIAYSWGVGRKRSIGEAERSSMEFLTCWLDRLASRLGLTYKCTFIMVDTHPRINGIPSKAVESYLDSAGEFVESRFSSHVRLSELLHKHGIDDIVGYLSSAGNDESQVIWSSINRTQRSELTKMAAVHSPDGDYELAAMNYCFANLIESPVIQSEFRDHVYITHLTHSMKFLAPNLPTIYAYVGPNRLRRRPWFQDEETGI